jgi:hypothetical protein
MDTAVQYVVGCHDFRNLCKMDVANGVVKYERRILSAKVNVLATDPFHNGADTASGLLHLKMVISVLYGEISSVQRLYSLLTRLLINNLMKILYLVVIFHHLYYIALVVALNKVNKNCNCVTRNLQQVISGNTFPSRLYEGTDIVMQLLQT